jgi:hypothetical protein
MNVEIGTEAAQFPEKEYINGVFFAVSVHGEVGIDKLDTSLKYEVKIQLCTHLLFLTEAVYCLAVNVKMHLFYHIVSDVCLLSI